MLKENESAERDRPMLQRPHQIRKEAWMSLSFPSLGKLRSRQIIPKMHIKRSFESYDFYCDFHFNRLASNNDDL